MKRHVLPAEGVVWLLVVLALAAANFLWQLGSPSYFVDEALSIEHALPSLGTVTHLVTHTETTPWTFFWGLHLWLHLTGSQAEWVTRLPSALAGVALAASVFWMARAFVERSGALLAATLTALSPLILSYAQQVRVYVFLMLALVIAVGLTTRVGTPGPGRTRRLAGGAAAAVVALWLHYTAALVVAPLCVWLALQRGMSRRARTAFAGVCLAAALIELPLFLRQYSYSPNGGIGQQGRITTLNVLRLIGTPFDGRYVLGLDGLRIIGLVVVLTATVVLLVGRSPRVRGSHLLVALGLTAPVVILIAGLAGKDVEITRYTAVAAPFMITLVAAAVVALPRPAALLLAGLTACASAWGLVETHQRSGFYAPARETLAFIQSHRVPGQVVVVPGHPGADVPLAYYAPGILRPLAPFIEGTNRSAVLASIHQRRPMWFVSEQSQSTSPVATRRFLTRAFSTYDYTPRIVHYLRTSTTFLVYLIAPS